MRKIIFTFCLVWVVTTLVSCDSDRVTETDISTTVPSPFDDEYKSYAIVAEGGGYERWVSVAAELWYSQTNEFRVLECTRFKSAPDALAKNFEIGFQMINKSGKGDQAWSAYSELLMNLC